MKTAPEPAAIKAVLFDLYGPLVDLKIDTKPPRIWTKLSHYISERAHPVRAAELRDRYHHQVARDTREHGEPFVLNREFFGELVRNGNQADSELVSDFAGLFRELTTTTIRLRRYVLPLFATLRTSGCKIGLVSNTDAQLTDHDLHVLRLRRHFDAIVLSSVVGVKKPDARIFDIALRDLGVEHGEAVHIGDDYSADFIGATRARVGAVLLDSRDPCATAPRFRDLISALHSHGWNPSRSRAA